MSMIKATTLLKDVKPYKQGWRVQVKLLHSWRQKTNYGGDTLEMIFADETGVKIHCSARKSLIQKTVSKLRLGEWRFIDTFTVSHARGQYRPTDHTYKMSIIDDTTIDQSTFECDDEFLNFPSFETIGNGTLNTHFLIVQVAGNDKKKVEFRLMDIKGQSIACCLWGKYAEQFEELLQQTKDSNMVCMIRFAKIGFYRGEVQITNAFDSSLICFNPDISEYLALKNNANDDFALALIDPKKDKRPIKDQTDDWNNIGIRSISEIIVANQEEDCKIICSIESIDTDWSWFYFGHKESEKPVFWCTNCRANTTTITPQFKLHLIVNDNTSTCKLMLLDSVAKIIVGCEAKEIWDGSYEEIEDPNILPQAVTELVGKTFCFGLTLGSENVKNGSDIFLVSQVWSGDKILQIESNSEPFTHFSSTSSIMSSGEVSLTEKHTCDSSEGSSTPFSKRKEKDHFDQTSTTKKLCTAVVKMEKIKDD
ncbi:hypothetical protein N665_1961s0004 [Sinapis alba]|nr:hypothetical protein N665_1961s0004 [Sinapis alba]